MTDHTSTESRPLWEEFASGTTEQLLGLMAGELWERTREPVYATQIAEAELAHIRAGGSWRTYIALESLYRSAATEQSSQSAWFGFNLAAALKIKPRTLDPQVIFDRTLSLAQIVPLSAEVKAEYRTRRERAMEECDRIREETAE